MQAPRCSARAHFRCRARIRLFAVSSNGARYHETVSSGEVLLVDLHDRIVPYEQSWQWQKYRARQLGDAVVAGQHLNTENCQALMILQHAPVYTLGTGSSTSNLKFREDSPPFPLFRTERGGEVTYHGPGQLTIYPVLDLRIHGKDLHKYLRQLEEVVIRALHAVSGIDAHREAGRTGVWTQEGKIAATGVRATRWITYHGIALNVCPNLAHFDDIIPCGIADAEVTSVESHMLQNALDSAQDKDSVVMLDDRRMLIAEYNVAIQESFEDVFNIGLISGRDPTVI